jgi:hypothetical protein
MTKGLTLWNALVTALLDELRALPQERIDYFWSTPSKRTEGYLASDQGLLPRIAQRLGMVFTPEVRRIDGEFKYMADGFPQIFAEVENNASSIAESELEKLCYVRAPLKLIITVCPWPNPELRDRWLKVIADCAKEWLPESPEVVYGFIIGECRWEEQVDSPQRPGLFFHLFAVSSAGELVDERPQEFIRWFSEAASTPGS